RHPAEACCRSLSASNVRRNLKVQQRSCLPLAFSFAKSCGKENEDRFQRTARGVYALSDGASVSFDSASWARILVRRYTQKPEFTQEWLAAAIAEFCGLYDRDKLPLVQPAPFGTGSFPSPPGRPVLARGK